MAFRYVAKYVLISLAATMVLVVAALLWVATTPRSLAPLIPCIEGSLSRFVPGKQIQLEDVVLGWDWGNHLTVSVSNLRIVDNHHVMLEVPRIGIDFQLSALLAARPAPTQVVLSHPSITLPNLSPGDPQAFALGVLPAEVAIRQATIRFSDPELANVLIHADVMYRSSEGRGAGTLEFSGLPLVVFSRIIDLRASGSADLHFDATGHWQVSRFRLHSEGGEIHAGLTETTVSVRDLVAEGSILERGSVVLDTLVFNFDQGSRVSASGVMADDTITGKAEITDLPVGNLGRYWPRQLAPQARHWILQHVTGGTIQSAQVSLDRGKLESAQLRFGDVRCDYHSPLLPLTAAEGEIIFSGPRITATIAKASLGHSRVSQGLIEITPPEAAIGTLGITGEIFGPANDLADFYLKLAPDQTYLLSLEGVMGEAQSHIRLRFPLGQDSDDFAYEVTSDISGGVVPHAKGDLTLSGITAHIELDRKETRLSGKLALTGRSHGLLLEDIPLTGTLSKTKDMTEAALIADLRRLDLNLPAYGRAKPRGDPAILKLKARLYQGGRIDISSLALEANRVRFIGRGTFHSDFTHPSVFELDTVRFGRNQFSLRVEKNRGYNIEVRGDALDLGPLLKQADAKGSMPDIDIKLNIDRVYLANDQEMSHCIAALRHHNNRYDSVAIAGDLGSGQLKATLSNDMLTAEASDSGALLRGLDWYGNMQGGQLNLSAHRLDSNRLDGELRVEHFSLVRAPTLAKILSLASLTGIADALTQSGLGVDRVKTKLRLDRNALQFSELRAVSPAIGVTADGQISLDERKLDIRGMIVPLRVVNSLVGRIPFIGDIVTGGEDEGLVAVGYKLQGGYADPVVTVNPLTLLTPGFLRRIFSP